MYWLSQVLTTQDGYAAAGSEPGTPDIVTTRSTPSRPATSIERCRSAACAGPMSGSGLSGLPLQFRPVSVIPASRNWPR